MACWKLSGPAMKMYFKQTLIQQDKQIRENMRGPISF